MFRVPVGNLTNTCSKVFSEGANFVRMYGMLYKKCAGFLYFVNVAKAECKSSEFRPRVLASF